MRNASANSVKRPSSVLQRIPREGTALRATWDLFQANKGKPVCIRLRPSVLRQLEDFYGLDIRHIYHGGGPVHYMLVGEWFGRVYIDYLAEELSNAQ